VVDTNNPSFKQEVANEEKDLQKEIDDTEGANLYPVDCLECRLSFLSFSDLPSHHTLFSMGVLFKFTKTCFTT
jgi:hypothetical protein